MFSYNKPDGKGASNQYGRAREIPDVWGKETDKLEDQDGPPGLREVMRLSIAAGGKPLDAVKVIHKYVQKPIKELLELVRSGGTVMTFTGTSFAEDFFARSRAQDGEGDLDMLLEILARLDQAGVGWLLTCGGRPLTIADVRGKLERWTEKENGKRPPRTVERDGYVQKKGVSPEVAKQLPEKLLGITVYGELTRVVDDPAVYQFAKLWVERLYDPLYTSYTAVCSAMSPAESFLTTLALREINGTLIDFVNLFEARPQAERALWMARPDGSEASLLQAEPELGYLLVDWVELYSRAPRLDVTPPTELAQWPVQPLTPPAELESFLRELCKKLVRSPLDNSRAFLWKKIVPEHVKFWKPAEGFTEQERIMVLEYQRMLRSTILREIFLLAEERAFRIVIDGKDFLSVCPNPVECLPGWLTYFCMK